MKPLKEFGTNFAEFYRDGAGAVEKLLAEKEGQVAGAFYHPAVGDITLVYGEAGTGKSDGFGLAKIEKYHPEVLDRLDEIISNGKFYTDEEGRPNIKLGNEIVGLRNNWKGKETPYWIVSSYKKNDELSKGIDSTKSGASKDGYSLATHQADTTTKTFNMADTNI